MEDLLLTAQTRAHLKALQTDPPHALMLTGAAGTGKLTVAKAWALQLASPEHISVIEPDEKGTITIETVRSLYRMTRSKHTERQIVIVDNAQSMGVEAQNAFLKLLEEPNAYVIFVLTAPSADMLLPTIISRLQVVHLGRASDKTLRAYIEKTHPKVMAQELAQLLFMADGRPATLVTLLSNKPAFDTHRQVMQQAKKLLTGSPYERLSMINALTKDRALVIETLEAMAHMLHRQLLRDPEPRGLAFAEGLEQCLVRLAQNGNPRAQLTALFSSY